jgi:hypothetical protein
MLQLGGLAFLSPWLLVALGALPALWWLLRVTPPSPKLVSFPPLRLLLALRPEGETPAVTPWWLILIRIVMAVLVILALAHPVLNSGDQLRGSGPLVLVIDNGWASASDWPARQQKATELIDQAEREARPVMILPTAASTPGEPIRATNILRAGGARQRLAALRPKPWPVDRQAALQAMDNVEISGSAHIVWLADGIGSEADQVLAERLQRAGGLAVVERPTLARAKILTAPTAEGEALSVPVRRIAAPGEQNIWVRAVSDEGRLLGRAEARFAAGEDLANAIISLPGELRNDVARLEIEGSSNAGSTFLVDERWRRRPVGLVSGDTAEAEQPLLSSIYFLKRALAPFVEIRQGSVSELLKREIAVVILADVGKPLDSDRQSLDAWMAKGGVILRFAGPKLAAGGDDMIPVRLRDGGRVLGGAVSWALPAKLLPFEENSPFAGLNTPDDVRVSRQVLAEPSLDLNQKTWARLSDGTPLVTAEKKGSGWLVLVHSTANTDWSNLPISGLFVEMLQRVVGLSAGVVSGDRNALLTPLETLDGFGQLGAPSPDAISISARDFADARPGPATPPGYYGPDNGRRALNLANTVGALSPIGDLASGVLRTGFNTAPPRDFKPWLLMGGLLLAIADLIISLAMRGLLNIPGIGRSAAAALLITVFSAAIGNPSPATAQYTGERKFTGPDARALAATLETRLAFVVTGDTALDNVTMAGLRGLSDVLRRRTAVEPGEPLAIDLETDELAFLPFLYWAISPRQKLLTENTRKKLNQFLKTGGTLLFDTRERGVFKSDNYGGVGVAGLHLRRLLQGLDVPALTNVPQDHVLTKSFYLLNDFPGRWAGGAVWVERRGGRHNDGVSSVMIGANDWATAWAIDSLGRPMAAVVPGGERQREMAYRFGVNWVMYALTGNYKTDQVHVPAIIDRLGQ